jgi:hypothetical protein
MWNNFRVYEIKLVLFLKLFTVLINFETPKIFKKIVSTAFVKHLLVMQFLENCWSFQARLLMDLKDLHRKPLVKS